MPRARILIVGDDIDAGSGPMQALHDQGYLVETACDGAKAVDRFAEFAPDLVVTSLSMPGVNGLQLLRKLRQKDPDLVGIVITAFGDVETVIRAMRAGARDCLAKPVSADELTVRVARALEHRRLRTEMRFIRGQLSKTFGFSNIVGSSPSMQAVLKAVSQVAPSRASVLITGEAGTGKELIATAIHERSPRANGPFVNVHCASLSGALLETELFGYERGSFMGADRRVDGCFVQAHNGTLFLNEIGEISPSVQLKLLRFLQEREFERIGGSEAITADVRLLTATHRDLQQMVASGRFREDLYYRLNVMTIDLSPLRARQTDIPLLAAYFLRKYAGDSRKPIRGLCAEALELLSDYSWPGNVRELENAVERAVALAQSAEITAADLPPHLAARQGRAGVRIPGATLEEIERYAITRTLDAANGSTARAAEILNISVRKIQYRLHDYAEPGPGEVSQHVQCQEKE